MKKTTENIGYVSLSINTKIKNKIYKEVEKYKKDFVYQKVNNKKKGGNVSKKLHLTMLFGFIWNKENLKLIKTYFKKNKLDKISTEEISSFEIQEYDCRVVILKIDDPEKLLLKINKDLQILLKTENKHKFIPHLSFAYVNKEVDIKKWKIKIPKKIKIEKISIKKY